MYCYVLIAAPCHGQNGKTVARLAAQHGSSREIQKLIDDAVLRDISQEETPTPAAEAASEAPTEASGQDDTPSMTEVSEGSKSSNKEATAAQGEWEVVEPTKEAAAEDGKAAAEDGKAAAADGKETEEDEAGDGGSPP